MKPHLGNKQALTEARHELWLRSEVRRLEETALPMLEASGPGHCLCGQCEPDCTCPRLVPLLVGALAILDCEAGLDSNPRWLHSSAPWGRRPLL